MVLVFLVFILLIISLGIILAFSGTGGVLFTIATALIALANVLPGFKNLVNEQLSKIEDIQIEQLPPLMGRLSESKWLSEIVTANTKGVLFLELDENGKIKTMFGGHSKYDQLTLEEFAEAARVEGGMGIPILWVDVNRLAGQRFISSPGPIFLFDSLKDSHVRPIGEPVSLKIQSSTAVMICSQTLKDQGFEVNVPLAILPDSTLIDQIVLQNSRTPGGTMKVVEFAKLKAAAKRVLVKLLNGEAFLGDAASMADIIVDLNVTEYNDAEIAAGAETANANALGQTQDQAQTTSNSEDVSLAKLAWQRMQCRLGFVFARCRWQFDHADLQVMVRQVFNAQPGGVIRHQIQMGPVLMDVVVTNPRVVFDDHKLAIKVDIGVENSGYAPRRSADHVGTVLGETAPAEPSGILGGPLVWLAEGVRVLGGAIGAVDGTVSNIQRSLVQSLSGRLIARDVVVSVGQIRFDKATRGFYLDNINVRDFSIAVGGEQNSDLGGFKPLLLSAVNEFLPRAFHDQPIYSLQGVRVYGIPLSWFSLETVGVSEADQLHVQVRLGRQFFGSKDPCVRSLGGGDARKPQ